MFGIGMPELMLILGIALIVIGPQKFPGMLRAVGKGLAELKRATNDIKSTVESEVNKVAEETELKEVKESIEKDFGGIATKMNNISYSSKTSEEQLNNIANLFDKDNDSSKSSSADTAKDSPSTDKAKD